MNGVQRIIDSTLLGPNYLVEAISLGEKDIFMTQLCHFSQITSGFP